LSDSLEFTGERFTPECEREIWYEHFHRYALAARWCAGADVLDAACGEGYGAALLARSAASVIGVDISAETVAHAQGRYGTDERLKFQAEDCASLPFAADTFDRVVSFETLEHVAAQEEMLSEFKRVLRPGGFLILSSPDKAVYSDQQGFDNEFHVRELYRDELEALIRRHFPAFRLLGQKLVFYSAIFSLERARQVTVEQSSGDGLSSPPGIGHAPMYFIALCAADESSLPNIDGRLWLFDDHAESVYEHYHGEIKRNMAAGGIIAGLEREISQLRRQSSPSRPSWWRRLLKIR
jgi:SAM-dependent methyltransferase